jgi:hypothetical protein
MNIHPLLVSNDTLKGSLLNSMMKGKEENRSIEVKKKVTFEQDVSGDTPHKATAGQEETDTNIKSEKKKSTISKWMG